MAIVSEVSGAHDLPASWTEACTGNNVALPPYSSNYLDAVRDSTKHYISSAGHHGLVQINAEGAKEYVDSFDISKFDKYVEHVNNWTRNLPLSFDNMAQEVNLIAILDLLQIGSGFRKELHEEAGRGASDTINFGCISLHISQTLLDAKGLQSLTLGDISSHFGIPLFGKERPMNPDNTAVMVSQASALRPLAEIILGTLQDTGRRLEQGGYLSFADFIIKAVTEDPTASHLVAKLVNAFPSLCDAAMIGERPVYLFKKAQLIAYDIYQRFGASDQRFAFADLDRMTLFADNVVPAMMQAHKLIVPCAGICAKIKNGEELTLEETTAMRAASIVAAQLVVDYANRPETEIKLGNYPINQATLDNFWWYEGKDPEMRSLDRLVCKKTVYF